MSEQTESARMLDSVLAYIEHGQGHEAAAALFDNALKQARHEERMKFVQKPCRHTVAATVEKPERDDLHQWQTAQSEWFDPTILEIVSEYATWRDNRETPEAQIVPGVLKCAKCDFRLVKTTLTPSGAYANSEPDTCPNCNVPMWRVTWKDEAQEAYKVAEIQMDRALEAERTLKARRDLIVGTVFERGEAVEWILANCMAIRRDNGALDYSLGAMIKAYEAGKRAASGGDS